MKVHSFINDDQDPKVVEKLLLKLNDILINDEEINYVAIQKKPVANVLPTTLIASTKRLFYCEPTNLGLTTNFSHFFWTDIKSVSFKEELFGSKFICTPNHGEQIITDYIPKIQARKLTQIASKHILALQNVPDNELEKSDLISIKPTEESPWIKVNEDLQTPVEKTQDELTLRLKKLKSLFDQQLISLEEYEQKKASILNEL